MGFEKKKQDYLKALVDTKAFLVRAIDEEPFTLRSGKQSCMFLDHSRLAAYPDAYRAYIDVIAALITDTFGQQQITLCNIDSKISAQMVGSLAYILKLPHIIYKSASLTAIEKGTKTQLTGNYETTSPIALVDDVASGGDGTAKKVGDLVQQTFPKVTDIHIFVGFVREIIPSTYKTHHVITRAELLQYVWESLSNKQKQAVEKEVK